MKINDSAHGSFYQVHDQEPHQSLGRQAQDGEEGHDDVSQDERQDRGATTQKGRCGRGAESQRGREGATASHTKGECAI